MRTVRRLMILLLCAFLLGMPGQSRADSIHNAVVAAVVGIVVGTAAITVGVVLLVKHKPSITGCAVSAPNGFSLKNEGDGRTYALRGDLASLAEGRRVRVTGSKHDEGSLHEFDVKHVTRNYGPCPVTPPA